MPSPVAFPDELLVGHGRGYSTLAKRYGVTPGPSAPSGPVIQDKPGNITADTTLVVTFDAATTSGNSLFAVITHTTASNISSIVTDAAENLARTTGGPVTRIAMAMEIWYLHNATSCTSLTLTVDATDDLAMTIVEVSPLNASAEEAYNENTSALGSTVTTNSVTPSSTNNFIIAAGAWPSDKYSTGPINGFTRGDPAGGAAVWHEVAYLSQTSATPQSTGWGLSTPVTWVAAIAAFGAP